MSAALLEVRGLHVAASRPRTGVARAVDGVDLTCARARCRAGRASRAAARRRWRGRSSGCERPARARCASAASRCATTARSLRALPARACRWSSRTRPARSTRARRSTRRWPRGCASRSVRGQRGGSSWPRRWRAPACARPSASSRSTPTRSPAASASGWSSRARWRSSPSLLVADEPVSSLDASVRGEILALMLRLVRETGVGDPRRHPRPRPGVEHRRPRGGDVPRADRRAGHDRGASCTAPAAPVHARAAVGRARDRARRRRRSSPARRPTRRGSRRAAASTRAARSSPPARRRGWASRSAAAGRTWRWRRSPAPADHVAACHAVPRPACRGCGRVIGTRAARAAALDRATRCRSRGTATRRCSRSSAGDLPRSWQYAGRIGRSPSPATLHLPRRRAPIVVVRGRDGVLRALHNVCRHRGSEVVGGPGRRTSLQCPYHAWTYGLDGALRAAPRSKREAGFDRGRSASPRAGGHVGAVRLRQRRHGRRAAGRHARRAAVAGGPRRPRRRRARASTTAPRTSSRPTGRSRSRTTWSATTARSPPGLRRRHRRRRGGLADGGGPAFASQYPPVHEHPRGAPYDAGGRADGQYHILSRR